MLNVVVHRATIGPSGDEHHYSTSPPTPAKYREWTLTVRTLHIGFK